MNNQESRPSSFLLSIMMKILACSIRQKRRKKKQEYSKGRDKTIPTEDSMIIYIENSKGLQKEGGKNLPGTNK